MKKYTKKKGFTLIELLVVIAIIAILAVVVVLTLNPAELLRQARDSNRESDFATIKSAIGLYAEDVATSTALNNASDSIYTANGSATSTSSTYTLANAVATTTWGLATSGVNAYNNNVATNTSRSVNGSGWIPLNLNLISSGAPIGSWPVDPVNSGNYMYLYVASTTYYKLVANMESLKYECAALGGNSGSDVETNDGGTAQCRYEQGTNLTAL